jgi:hypothetical protein
MHPVKKIIIEETARVLRELKEVKKLKMTAKNLYEAVKTSSIVRNNPKKYRIVNKIVSINENKFMKERQRIKENHQYEDESEMAKAQLLAIMEKSKELYQMIGDNVQLEDWVQYKLSIAENYMDAVHGYMKYFNGGEEMNADNMNDDQFDDVDEEEFEDFDDEEFEDFDDEGYAQFDAFDDEDFEDFDDEDEDDFEEFGV